MCLFMKFRLLLSLIFGSTIISSCKENESKTSIESTSEVESTTKLKEKFIEAKKYCQAQQLNTDFFFLIDLNKHSGLKRFYVWSFNNENISNSFLVSHGCGNLPWGQDLSKKQAVVSNLDDSHTSSVGKYIIGNRGYSNWGIHVNYLLHGQEASNNNALSRQIVLHSWERVSDDEIYPYGTPEGWGCPAVSNSSMYIIDNLLQNSNRNVLMWIIQ